MPEIGAEGTGDEKRQPERRAEIAHEPDPDLQAAAHFDSAREEKPEVLEIARAPAAVAGEHVAEIRRTFLVAARFVVGDPDPVPGAAHQRGFNGVMAEDVALAGIGHGQQRQVAIFDERRDADDGVVAPVGAGRHLRHAAALRKKAAVDFAGKLQHAPKQRTAEYHVWLRLDDAGGGVGLHRADEPDERGPGHDAIGVEHDHVAVSLAPTAAKICDISALAVDAMAALPVEDFSESIERRAQREPGAFLLDPVVRVGRVAADIEVELFDLAGLFQASPHVGDGFADAAYLFVVDGDDDGRGGERNGVFLFTPRSAHDVVTVAATQLVETAEQREDKTNRDLAEEKRENGERDVIFPEFLTGIAFEHQHESRRCERGRKPEEQCPADNEVRRVVVRFVHGIGESHQ